MAFVKGLQGDDPKYLKLVSTLKHYAVNNVEKDRQKLSATVSERMLHEYWLPHFRDCIVEGQAQSVMASYNAINGVPEQHQPAAADRHPQEAVGLRGLRRLGPGRRQHDGQGPRRRQDDLRGRRRPIARSPAAISPTRNSWTYIPAAVRKGLLPEARLNDALFRVLRARFRLGEFDPPAMVPYSRISPNVICSAGAPATGAEDRAGIHRAAEQQRPLPAAGQEQAQDASP